MGILNEEMLLKIFDEYRNKCIEEFLEIMPIGTKTTMLELDNYIGTYFVGSVFDGSLHDVFGIRTEDEVEIGTIGSWTYYESDNLTDEVIYKYIEQIEGDYEEDYELANEKLMSMYLDMFFGTVVEFSIINKCGDYDSLKWEVELKEIYTL